MTHVALLRGINVGGNNKLPMAELVKLVEAAGGRDVSTYIQSGNAIFQASAAVAKRMPAALAAAIAKHHRLAIPVVTRTGAELAAILAANPFVHAGVLPEKLHVMFLAATPTPKAIATLDPARSPPDEFVVHGAHVYVHFANGSGRTKLTNAYIDGKLATTSTMRNWNTVRALAELAAR